MAHAVTRSWRRVCQSLSRPEALPVQRHELGVQDGRGTRLLQVVRTSCMWMFSLARRHWRLLAQGVLELVQRRPQLREHPLLGCVFDVLEVALQYAPAEGAPRLVGAEG